MALRLDLVAPCKVPSLPQPTEDSVAETPGEQVVLLVMATRGRAEHTLAEACHSWMETTQWLERAWILAAPGPFSPRPLEDLLLSCACILPGLSDWNFHPLILILPFGAT